MKKQLSIASVAMLALLASCGTSKPKTEEVKHEEIKKDFVVVDASLEYRPIWVTEVEDWADKYKIDMKEYRYFSYETEAKNDREIACKMANANARSHVASEIKTFIKETFVQNTEGDANIDSNDPEIKALSNYIDNTLSQTIEAAVSGSSVMKTYWEKRSYKKDLGAKKDYVGFTCASLIRMKRELLDVAIEKAGKELEKQATSSKAKEKVQKVLEETKKNFTAEKAAPEGEVIEEGAKE